MLINIVIPQHPYTICNATGQHSVHFVVGKHGLNGYFHIDWWVTSYFST